MTIDAQAPVSSSTMFVDPAGRPVAVPVEPVTAEAQPLAHRVVASSSRRHFAVDSLIVGAVGLALTIVGLLAVTRAGIHGPMNDPVVKVFGFTHTETLGLLETAMGLLLLICAAATSRRAAMFFGLVLGVGGVIGAIQTSSFRRSLALQSNWAWIAVAAAGLVVLVSLLAPRTLHESTTLESN